VSSVWASEPSGDTSAGGAEVLRLLGGSNHEVPELRRAQLRTPPPVDLRPTRPRRGLRAPVPKLLLLSHGLEGLRVGPRGSCFSYYPDYHLFTDGPLTSPASLARPEFHGKTKGSSGLRRPSSDHRLEPLENPRPESAPFVPFLPGPAIKDRSPATGRVVKGARPRRTPSHGLGQEPASPAEEDTVSPGGRSRARR
jgi:hypothetical protein